MTPNPCDRVQVFTALIAKPDPFDCWRRHRLTQEGKPERFAVLDVQASVHRTTVLVDRDNERLQ